MVGNWPQDAKVGNDDRRDENPQQHDELALRDQIGLARFVNQLRDFAHRPMHRQVLELKVDPQPESEAEKTESNADEQQAMAIDPAE